LTTPTGVLWFLHTAVCNVFIKKQKSKENAMKSILMVTTTIFLFNICGINAGDFCTSLQAKIVRLGDQIEKIDVPGMGKLTHLLPFAVLTSSLKSCPLQTMAVVVLIVGYNMLYNQGLRSMMGKYKMVPIFAEQKKKQVRKMSVIDESFFMYEEDLEDMEDDLLDMSLLEEQDADCHKTPRHSTESAY
jgi:hypothetical protein